MKKPTKAAAAAGGKHKSEKPQGKVGGSGINKIAREMPPAKVPQVEAKTRYGRPSQTQKMG